MTTNPSASPTVPRGGAAAAGRKRPEAEILVVNTKSNEVSFLDTSTDEVTDTLAVGNGPRDAVWSSPTDRVFIALGETGEVAVLDPTARAVIRNVLVGQRPLHVYHHPTRPEIWVGNDNSATVSVLDDRTGDPIATVAVGDGHHKIAFTPDGRLAFATNIRSADVTVIDANSHATLRSLIVGRAPHGIAATRDGRYVLVANNGDEVVTVIDVGETAVIEQIPSQRPNYIGLTPDGRQAWVVCATDRVDVIDLSSMRVVETIPVGQAPDRVVFGPNSGTAFVNNTHSDTVTAINMSTLTVAHTVDVEAGGSHQGMAFDADGARLYVANYVAGSISVLDAANPRVVKRVVVGQGPAAVIRIGT